MYEAQQRSTYGDRTLEAIVRGFGISQRQAQKYALVWKVFFAGNGGGKNVNIDVFSLDKPSWYVVAATETNEPEKWLAYAQDRKEEDPRYSVTAFRRDILLSCAGQASLDTQKAPGSPESSVQPPILEHRTCPWIRLICVRSGKPTPVEECCDCEFRKT